MRSISIVLTLFLIFAGCSSESDEQGSGMDTDSTDAMTATVNRPPLPAENDVVAEIIESAVFTDLDGNEVTLADFRGKVLVLDFWETWCTPCIQLFPKFQELIEEYPEDFSVVAVTLGYLDGPEEVREFQKEHGYDFSFVIDNNNVSDELGVKGIPYKIFIDPQGEFIKQVVGLDFDIGDFESTKAVIEKYRVK